MSAATESYVRPTDGALMVAIAPWVFVADRYASVAVAAADRGSRRPQAETRVRKEAF